MAPISKETETAVLTTTAAAPANPSKAPTEHATRPQPVALEIPVSINGAHTVAGSDKREPFSESTQTVLVFGHGAVVRVAATLAPGQLVFLTNEKTKKEVVCQVLKSKSGGTGSNYVELQFTEPSPGFWGLRLGNAPAPAPPAAPVAPRPASVAPPTIPAVPKASVPAPVALQPAAPSANTASLPVAPKLAPPTAPPKPAVLPPSVAQVQSPALQAPTPVTPVPLVSVPPPSPLSARPESTTAHASTPNESALHVAPPPAPAHEAAVHVEKPAAAIPVPPLHNYAKEIDALFSVSSRPTAPPAVEPKPAPPASTPSSDQLKLEAARLQAQLSSMLFTETPAAPKTEIPVADVAKKVVEIAHTQPKSVVLIEPKPTAPSVSKPSAGSLAAEEEVKIPSWLAPLSRTSEPAIAEPPAATPPEPNAIEMPALPAESSEAGAVEPTHRPEAAVFGGQLLGENAEAPASGSKKRLWIGLAAAALVLAAGATWYLKPGLFLSAPPVSAKAASRPIVAASNSSLARSEESGRTSAPLSGGNFAAVPVTPTPAPVPVKAPEKTAVQPVPASAKNPTTVAHSAPPPAPEPEKKPVVGDVHLAAPVISRGAQQGGDALPSIDTHAANGGADPLAGVEKRNQPAAPIPVGGEVKPAQLLKSVAPAYPSLAKAQHIAGNVTIDALVDTSGNVADLKVISGPPLLHRAALDAVKQWKYNPALLDGQPTASHLTVTVQFRAQ
jgi:periplasmic protein TonB